MAAGAAWIGIVAALELWLWVARPTADVPGLLQVGAQLVGLVGLALAPLALVRGAWLARAALLVLVVILVARFGDEWTALPGPVPPAATEFTLATWSLEVEPDSPGHTVDGLRAQDADIVLLQELNRAAIRAIEADAALTARYPFRTTVPDPGIRGLGLLSRFPILDLRYPDDVPAVQEVLLDVHGRRVWIVNGHPNPGRLGRPVLGIPTRYDPSDRDANLALIAGLVQRHVSAGDLVLLAGDLNTAPPEKGFDVVSAGLVDAQRAAGVGPGWTWRPFQWAWLPFGLLRLDVALAGPGLTPRSTAQTCTPYGEHCRLEVRIQVDAAGP